MPAKAVIAPSYRWRLLLLTALFSGFGLFFGYDGFIRYPAQQKSTQHTLLEQDAFNRAYRQTHGRDPEFTDWQKYAESQDPPLEVKPGTPKTDSDIHWQIGLMLLTLPIGLYFLWVYLNSFQRWVGSSETGLESSFKVAFPYGSIKTLDKSRWDRKGIAVVRASDNGGDKVLVLDDWKYDRYATKTILLDVESRLTDEQITSGKREAAADAAGDTAAAPAPGASAPTTETTGG